MNYSLFTEDYGSGSGSGSGYPPTLDGGTTTTVEEVNALNLNDEIFFSTNQPDTREGFDDPQNNNNSNTANTTPEFQTPPQSTNYDYMNKRTHSNSFSLPIDQLNLLTIRPLTSQSSNTSKSPSPTLSGEFPHFYNPDAVMEEPTINPRQLFNDHKPIAASYSSPSLTTLFKQQELPSQQARNINTNNNNSTTTTTSTSVHRYPHNRHSISIGPSTTTAIGSGNSSYKNSSMESPVDGSSAGAGIQNNTNTNNSITPRFDFIMNDECLNAIHYWLNSSSQKISTDVDNDSCAEIIGNPTGILKYQRRRNSIQVPNGNNGNNAVESRSSSNSTSQKKKRRKSCNYEQATSGQFANTLKEEEFNEDLSFIKPNTAQLPSQRTPPNVHQSFFAPTGPMFDKLKSNQAFHKSPPQLKTQMRPFQSPKATLPSQSVPQLRAQHDEFTSNTPYHGGSPRKSNNGSGPAFNNVDTSINGKLPGNNSGITSSTTLTTSKNEAPTPAPPTPALTTTSSSTGSSSSTTKSNNQSDEDDDSDEEKPFPCPECTKQFKRSEHLKRHIRSVHSNIRPFHCKYCEKKFSRSDNLAQHLKTHYKTLPDGTTTIILGNPNLYNRGGRRGKGSTSSV
ncbi:hypothetical protein CAAN1_09S04368 [[Candida] anglica]|uniref:C2H2-type domain-containing protein n=1 Tax=[Candida] anglica TaxID=148631 RepID=A0ABP0EF39_9ASCO